MCVCRHCNLCRAPLPPSRRAAFGERYAQSAEKLAESMGRFREKEVASREAFARAVERCAHFFPTFLSFSREGFQLISPLFVTCFTVFAAHAMLC